MPDRDTTSAALAACYDDLEGLIADLGDHEWDVQSLCPDWTVKGVLTHLAGIESILVGWMPEADDEPPPFQKYGAFETDAAGLSGSEIAAKTSEILAARRTELAAMTDDQWAHKCMTPVGPGYYGRFMDVRVFDFWVHQRDMTMPLGRSTVDGGANAEIALNEVHGSLGYIVGKKIGLEDGMSIGIHLTGPIERDMYVNVDGRAGVVDSVDSPTVHLTADSTSFIMLACGRIDPQSEIDAGRISWSGDAGWGEKAARNLRFTM